MFGSTLLDPDMEIRILEQSNNEQFWLLSFVGMDIMESPKWRKQS